MHQSHFRKSERPKHDTSKIQAHRRACRALDIELGVDDRPDLDALYRRPDLRKAS